MSEFWHKFNTLKFGNRCRACGASLPAGRTTAWGTKDGNGRWIFLCERCYREYEKNMRAEASLETAQVEPEFTEELATASMAEDIFDAQDDDNESPDGYRPLLDVLRDEAPWRLA